MKTILCYGDSNTYGYNPENGLRFPREVRWPGALQDLLGEDYVIVEEGCNGRTTVIRDEIEPWKCGEDYLRACLNSHKPVDLVVMMLGTNDMKRQYHVTARDVANGAERLVSIIQIFTKMKQDFIPEILLVAPPILREGISDSIFGDSFSEDAVKVSEQLGELFRDVAERKGCLFLNAADIVVSSREDHLHLRAEEHGKLAAAIAGIIREMEGEKP